MFLEFPKVVIIIFFFNLILVGNVFAQSNDEVVLKLHKFTYYDTLKNSPTPGRVCYDALQYQLDLTVEPSKRYIKGVSTMKFNWLGNSKKLQLDLITNYKINSITLDNKQVKFVRDSNFIFIDIPESFAKGTIHNITTTYEGHPMVAKKAPWDGGFVWDKDSLGNDWVGVACEGLGASSWWPCKDHWADEPQEGVKLSFSVPEGYTAVSNGKLISNKTSKNQSIWKWEVLNPINLYDVTLNIAKYAHIDTTYTSKVDGSKLKIDYYVLPYNLQKAKIQFLQVYSMFDCFESKFGKYPFYEDGYKLVETPYLGMEHQSCVSYGNKYMPGYLGHKSYTGGYNFDYIIIHESGHEWFGNNITAEDNADMWIHEAFTTYSESIYVECLYGKDAALEYISKMKPRVENDDNIQGLYGTGFEGSGDMYAKGALFINTLRSQVDNDSLWFAYLKELNKRFYHQVTSYEKVLSMTNAFFKYDYRPLFETYLKSMETPRLNIFLEYTYNGESKYILFYKSISPKLALNTYIKYGDKSQKLKLTGDPTYLTIPAKDSIIVDDTKNYILINKINY